MRTMKFEGIYTPIITPYTADGNIDKDTFAEVVEFFISSGVHYIVVGGSTGEYYTQTNEEHIEWMNLAIEGANQLTLMIVSIGATSTQNSLILA